MKEKNKVQLLVEDIMLSASGSFGGEMTKKGDSKLVTEIQKYFKKHKVELQSVAENGEMVTIKGRLVLSKAKNLQQQFQRESAKAIIYDFKYEFEKWAIDTFKTPNVSLTGIKVNSNDSVDFALVMIYTMRNKLEESVDLSKGLGNDCTPPVNSNFPPNSEDLFEAEETETEEHPKVTAAETELSLQQAMKEWDRISMEIKHKEDMFKVMIQRELADKKELEDKIYKGLKYLDVKTKKVDSVVAKWKVGFSRQIDASPSQLWAAALTKVNEATRNVLLQMQKDMKKTSEVAPSFSISKEQPGVVTEGVGDSIKGLLNKLKNWFLSLKDFCKSVDELEKLANNSGELKENKQHLKENIERTYTVLKSYTSRNDNYDYDYESVVSSSPKQALQQAYFNDYTQSEFEEWEKEIKTRFTYQEKKNYTAWITDDEFYVVFPGGEGGVDTDKLERFLRRF